MEICHEIFAWNRKFTDKFTTPKFWNISSYEFSYKNLKIALNNLKVISKITKKPLAIDIQEKLLKIEPTKANYLQLSYDYYRLKMYDKCIEISNSGLKKYPESFGLYNNVAVSYIALKEYKLAEDACKKGLKIKPDNELLIKHLKRIENLKQ